MSAPRPVHLDADALEAYVLDVLEPQAARALEQHVRCCDRCAEALAAQARREEALVEMVPRIARQQPRAPAASNPWLSPFLLAATSALALVVTAANPRAIRLADGPPALWAQAMCQESAAQISMQPPLLLCLGDGGGGERASCTRPMSVELDPGPLFSCSGCFCPAERPR